MMSLFHLVRIIHIVSACLLLTVASIWAQKAPHKETKTSEALTEDDLDREESAVDDADIDDEEEEYVLGEKSVPAANDEFEDDEALDEEDETEEEEDKEKSVTQRDNQHRNPRAR